MATMSAAHADEATIEVPGFRVQRLVGRGGQARVYAAERIADGRTVALKILERSLADDAVYLARFSREQRIVAALADEHLPRLYGHGVAAGHPYLALEYLGGGTLAARIRSGIAPREALAVVADVARALSAIHAHGVVHRDLKPANILFRAPGTGARGRPVIVDFGLAKDLASAEAVTAAGALVCTPRYMSPEQCLGAPVDARSDLYSLGVVFYEMLTGAKLFAGLRPHEIVRAHLHGAVAPLPAGLAGYQRVLDRLLARHPAERFQSALELYACIAA